MTNNEIIALVFQTLAIVGAGLAAYIALIQRVTRLEVKFEMFVMMVGEKAARALRSPHTPELDVLLDKYIDEHYELTLAEWMMLKNMCDEMASNEVDFSKTERSLAGWIAAVCEHKLSAFRPEDRDAFK